jgi:ATP-dependent RNA helicase RhlE
MLHNPERVAVTPVAKTADRVKQSVIHVEAPRKGSLLVELFSDPAMRRTLVFTRTKRGADKVARHLEAAGIKVAAIHGNKSLGQREAALGAFRNGRIRGLVATDIAARGIDIDEVTHVINFDLPHVPESYVHRIGRTARAGAEGIAISLCGREERTLLRDIERLTRQSIESIDRREDAGGEPLLNNGHGLLAERRSGSPAKFRNGRNGSGNGNRPAGGNSKQRRHRSAAIAR